MLDARLKTLAHSLIHYCCELKKGETIIIENYGLQAEFVAQLVHEVGLVGGNSIVWLRDMRIERERLLNGSTESWDLAAQSDAEMMRKAQAYIGLRSVDNGSETVDVPQEKMDLYALHYSDKVHSKVRIPHTRWVVLRFPTSSMAQSANMSTEAFEDFYFNVCNFDYSKMSLAMDKLVAYMQKTDKVRLKGPGTDLTFSIKGIPAIKCDGKLNVPDGEVFTAPVKTSINGRITFNTPSVQMGTTFENISFLIKDGKIVEATSNDTEKINKVLDVDEGARYIGEFSFGINPYITFPMKNTLFDEKIAGSIHFTPGACYEDEAPNGNSSSLHWDLVLIQTPEYGGGEIYFDDLLIRKDGLFVVPELECLNPEALLQD